MENYVYERCWGEDGTLAASVARLHAGGPRTVAHGRVDVIRGTGWVGRAVAVGLRLPRAGRQVPLCLVIERRPDGERWRRSFGGQHLVTEQRSSHGLLLERFGPCELRLRATIRDGALLIEQEGAALRLGPVSLRVPRRLQPRVRATARAHAVHDVAVSVRVSMPSGRLLLHYAGTVDEALPDPAGARGGARGGAA